MKAVEGEKTKAAGEAAKKAEKVEKVEELTAVWRKRMSSGSVVSGGEVDGGKAAKKRRKRAGEPVEECKLKQDEE